MNQGDAIYILLTAFAFFLLVRSVKLMTSRVWVAYVAGALCLIIFGDISYTSYFNSFYEEPAAYVSFLLTIGLAMTIVTSSKRNLWQLAAFGLSAAAFVTAKQQDLPLVIPLVVICVWLTFVHKGTTWKVLGVVISLALVLVSAADYKFTKPVYNEINVFESVFRGVLAHQPKVTAMKDLKWFGVDTKYATLANTSWWAKKKAYNVESSQFKHDFFDKVNHVTVVEFYVTHPVRFYQAMQSSADAAVKNRPDYLGNFQKSSGYPPVTLAHRMSAWSHLKRMLMPKSVWGLVTFYVFYFGVLLYRFKSMNPRSRAMSGIFLMIGLMSVLEFPVPYTAEGVTELVKHLFVFNVVTDFMSAAAVTWILYKIFSIRFTHARRTRAGKPMRLSNRKL